MANVANLIVDSALNVVGVRTAKEPNHVVVETLGEALEVRRYDERLVAETEVVETDETMARNEGFSRLAGYIFGKNRASRQIAMTTPVETSRKIAMTAPVETRRARDAMMMRFYMPEGSTLDTAPMPLDPRVRLVRVPPEHVAVLRFRGLVTEAVVADRVEALMDAVSASPWRAIAPPVTWFYDPPFSVPFLRRNEVAVTVERR